MAFQSLGSGVRMLPFANSLAFNGPQSTIDAATERFAICCLAPKTGTINTVELGFRSVTLNVASVLRVSLQGQSGGEPNGTQSQFRDLTTAPTANSWYSIVGLITSDGTDGGTKRSVTQGEPLCVVVEYQTFTTGDSVQLSNINTALESTGAPAYSGLYTGSWTLTAMLPSVAIVYDDGSKHVPLGALPMYATTTTSFNSSSNPKERGLKWTPNVPVRVNAIVLAIDADAAADIVLYEGTTEIDAFSINVTFRPNPNRITTTVLLDTAWDLAAGTMYRIVVRPTTTSNVQTLDVDVGSAETLDHWYGGGTFEYTEKSSDNVWTDTPTKFPALSPMAVGFDDGAGGGGGGGETFSGGQFNRGFN